MVLFATPAKCFLGSFHDIKNSLSDLRLIKTALCTKDSFSSFSL